MIQRPLRSWRGFSAEHVVVGTAPYEFERIGTSHFLALHDMIVDDGEVMIDGMEPSRARDLRNSVAFIPKGLRSSGWMAPHKRRNAFTALYFDPSLVNEELERRYDLHQPSPFLFVQAPALRTTLSKLENILVAPAVDDMLAESVCLVAALEVFGIQSDPVGVGLSERHLKLVDSYVRERLAERVSLSDLATLCGLSRFHFSRAFKKATGISPYAFVTRRRIERSVELLADPRLGIEVIAVEVGFPNTSQFRRAFRGIMGCSAQQYRRLRR